MKLLVVCAFLFSFSALASNKGVDVIYGQDNRKDVFETRNSAFVELSRSTAAMISFQNLRKLAPGPGDVLISGQTLKDRGVCSKERFSTQVTAADCSGFLINEDILVTAGHCIKTEADCRAYKWVFDYKVDSSQQKFIRVPESSIYSCKKIISRVLDQTSMDDYAVIQLDRKTDRRPLVVRTRGKVAPGTPVAVIGHPSGLPTKIADGANVRSLNAKYFVANLDTFGGNSGSAVFNVRTGEVEGILVRGENDYVMDPKSGCQVSNRCQDNACRGEDVTYITNIRALQNLL